MASGVQGIHIKTFVFLDLETTGLEVYCKITELCMCAVSRAALLRRPITQRFPRVLDKLILCFDPATEVDPIAEEITGLSRELLLRNNRNVFSSSSAEFLKSFLKMQAPPVCLVAHSGYRFDFRIIAYHFKDVGVELPEEMYLVCADTLSAFMKLRPKPRTVNFKLSTLYSKYVGRDAENAHTAEGDCLNLLELVYRTADEVVPWADENAKGFTHEGHGTVSMSKWLQRRSKRKTCKRKRSRKGARSKPISRAGIACSSAPLSLMADLDEEFSDGSAAETSVTNMVNENVYLTVDLTEEGNEWAVDSAKEGNGWFTVDLTND